MDVSGSLVACALLLLATEVICNSVLFVGGITMETCKTHLISENLFTLVSIPVCICVIGLCCCHCCQGNMQEVWCTPKLSDSFNMQLCSVRQLYCMLLK